jgi:hypothetical protein
MKEYDVICDLSLDRLTTAVNEKLRQGWEVQGGPFQHSGCICQAVIRTKPLMFENPYLEDGI